jgi:4'-phosphopantetheinyl transferase
MRFEIKNNSTSWNGLAKAVLDLSEQEPLVIIASKQIVTGLDDRLLVPYERERYKQFRFDDDRERYLTTHALKRRVLGALHGCLGIEMCFTTRQGEKPRLQGDGPNFNLSHSGNWVAMIVSTEAQVGIDVEQPSIALDHDKLASLVFHPQDRFLPEPASPLERFYTAWTLKEAISKGVGLGLSLPLNELRLRPMGQGYYHCLYQQKWWHTMHWRIENDAHMAIACGLPWRKACILRVVNGGESASDT